MGGEDFGCDGVLVYVDECAVTVSRKLKSEALGEVLGEHKTGKETYKNTYRKRKVTAAAA
jgi:hypothetical protein